MAELWPASLPCAFIRGSIRYAIGNNQLRSENAVGPDKVRPRGTSKPDKLSGRMRMTSAQWDALEALYKSTLLSGSLVFDFPWRGGTREARFVEPPECVDIAGGVWYVDLALELMP